MTQPITPEQLKAAEEHWQKLRAANDPAAAEAYEAFQDLAFQHTEQMQSRLYQGMITRMLK